MPGQSVTPLRVRRLPGAVGFFPPLPEYPVVLLTERECTTFPWMQNPSQAGLRRHRLSLHADLSRPTRFAELGFSQPKVSKPRCFPRPPRASRDTCRSLALLPRAQPAASGARSSCGDASQLFLESPSCSRRVQGKRGGKSAPGTWQGHPRAPGSPRTQPMRHRAVPCPRGGRKGSGSWSGRARPPSN